MTSCYSIDGNRLVVLVLKVGHRKDVYRSGGAGDRETDARRPRDAKTHGRSALALIRSVR
jgi:hypothetical protein